MEGLIGFDRVHSSAGWRLGLSLPQRRRLIRPMVAAEPALSMLGELRVLAGTFGCISADAGHDGFEAGALPRRQEGLEGVGFAALQRIGRPKDFVELARYSLRERGSFFFRGLGIFFFRGKVGRHRYARYVTFVTL